MPTHLYVFKLQQGPVARTQVIQQQFKGKKIGLNDDALEFARLHTEHVRSFLKWIDKLSESVLTHARCWGIISHLWQL